jgi:hypothetical protein
MEEIEVNLEICTVYKGVPYGLAMISYIDYNDPESSFKGIGVFRDGKLQDASFTCVAGDGFGYSFSKMIDGRPCHSNNHTLFY